MFLDKPFSYWARLQMLMVLHGLETPDELEAALEATPAGLKAARARRAKLEADLADAVLHEKKIEQNLGAQRASAA